MTELVQLEHEELELMVIELDLPEPALPELTPSEREVALRVADGLSNAEIAEERGVALRTIANQVRSIFQKLGVCSRWDLALLLTRRSLEPPEAPDTSGAPEVITTRRSRAPRTRSGMLNSRATVGVLRAAYARAAVDFDAVRASRGIALVGEGALRRDDYCALFEELAALTETPDLGLELARTLPVGALGLLEWLGLSAPTLGDALDAVSAHGGLLHGGGRRVTRARGEQVVVAYWVDGVRAPRAVIDWSFGCLYERLRAVAGGELAPLEVRVQYDDPGDGRAEDFFQCPVRFGAQANEIVVPRELTALALPSGDRETFEALSGVAQRRVQAASRPTTVSRTSALITRELAAGRTPRSDVVARRLGTSAGGLARELARSGVRFEDLLASCRVDRAVRALEGTGAGPREVGDVIRRTTR